MDFECQLLVSNFNLDKGMSWGEGLSAILCFGMLEYFLTLQSP